MPAAPRRRAPSALCWLYGALLVCFLAACAHGAAGASRAAAPLAAPPLVTLLSPGAEPVLIAHPRALFQAAASETLWRALVEPERERAFVQRTGVDPRTLDELVVREEGAGYLLLARGPFDAAEVVRAAGARLALPDVSTEQPYLRREGLAGQGRFAYAALGADTVLVARDLPPQRVAEVLATWSAAVTARASGTLPAQTTLPSVISEEPAASLAAEHGQAPVLVLAPRPLALPTDSPLGVVLAEQRALAAVAEPSAARIAFRVDIRGNFPQGVDANFRALGHSLAGTALMGLLGLGPALETLHVQAELGKVVLRGDVAAADLVAGLRALFFADARALFQ